MNNEEKLEKILGHITADGDILNDTNKSLHIDAIAYEPAEKGGLIAYGHNANADQFFVASDLKVWTTDKGVEKVCWGGGAYFDSLVDAIRYFRVFADGAPIWSDERYASDYNEYLTSHLYIVSVDQITSSIWDWHTYECQRLRGNGKELTETQDLASYEIFLSKSLQYILRWMLDGSKVPDEAYGIWYYKEARNMLEDAIKTARSWY
jgi:hypothetical protein